MKHVISTKSALLGLCLFSTVAYQASFAGEVSFGERTPSVNEFVDALSPAPEMRFRGIRPAQQPTEPPKPAKASMQLQFEFDSAQLTTASKKSLDNLSEALKTNQLQSYRFVIEGHTDAMGSESYNQSLSERRAASVKGYLIQKHSIDAERLDVVGLGESAPLNDSNPFDASNRRVAILNVGE